MYAEVSDDEDLDELDAVQFRVKSRGQPSGAEDPGEAIAEEPQPVEAAEEPEEEEYEVERILNKRIKKGKVEYLVKWKGEIILVPTKMSLNCIVSGWDLPEHNTWQTPEDLENSKEELAEYENKLQNEKVKKKYGLKSNIKPRGFSRGLEAEAILDATFDTGQIFFLVKWRDSDLTDIVPAREANIRIPEMVISFYEERMEWGEEEEEECRAETPDEDRASSPIMCPDPDIMSMLSCHVQGVPVEIE